MSSHPKRRKREEEDVVNVSKGEQRQFIRLGGQRC
jgi:hypothetical protein